MDIHDYVAGWRARRERRAEQCRAATTRARAHLDDATRELCLRGARRVWLVGSLARGTFTTRSDLDFLVEGMTAEDAWRAADDLSERLGIGVDVLRTEALSPGWRRHHETYGELVHG